MVKMVFELRDKEYLCLQDLLRTGCFGVNRSALLRAIIFAGLSDGYRYDAARSRVEYGNGRKRLKVSCYVPSVTVESLSFAASTADVSVVALVRGMILACYHDTIYYHAVLKRFS